jgi:hypothetical protein
MPNPSSHTKKTRLPDASLRGGQRALGIAVLGPRLEPKGGRQSADRIQVAVVDIPQTRRVHCNFVFSGPMDRLYASFMPSFEGPP